MTAPQPPAEPTTGTIAALVELSHKLRDAAEIKARRLHLAYWLGIVVALGLLAFAATELYAWHEAKLDRLELSAGVLQHQLDATTLARNVWQTQALALVNVRRVDTLRTDSIIRSTRTQIVTITMPVARVDGSVSAVPMPFIPLAQFDATVDACARERHDCSQVVAAKDTLLHLDSLRIALAESLFVNASNQVREQKRASTWAKLKWGTAGVGVGGVLGVIATLLAVVHK